jgi:hypothetical protein
MAGKFRLKSRLPARGGRPEEDNQAGSWSSWEISPPLREQARHPSRDDCGGSLTSLVGRADQTIDTELVEQWDRMGQLYASLKTGLSAKNRF